MYLSDCTLAIVIKILKSQLMSFYNIYFHINMPSKKCIILSLKTSPNIKLT